MPNLTYGPEIFEHKLAQLYVGFFNRLPDEKGFRYHLDAVDNNSAFEWKIFSSTTELGSFKRVFGGL